MMTTFHVLLLVLLLLQQQHLRGIAAMSVYSSYASDVTKATPDAAKTLADAAHSHAAIRPPCKVAHHAHTQAHTRHSHSYAHALSTALSLRLHPHYAAPWALPPPATGAALYVPWYAVAHAADPFAYHNVRVDRGPAHYPTHHDVRSVSRLLRTPLLSHPVDWSPQPPLLAALPYPQHPSPTKSHEAPFPDFANQLALQQGLFI